jgi:hypothetical protein
MRTAPPPRGPHSRRPPTATHHSRAPLNFDFAFLNCLTPRLCSLMVRRWSTVPISLSYTTPTTNQIGTYTHYQGRELQPSHTMQTLTCVPRLCVPSRWCRWLPHHHPHHQRRRYAHRLMIHIAPHAPLLPCTLSPGRAPCNGLLPSFACEMRDEDTIPRTRQLLHA